MQSIPDHLYEAARIDGATRTQMFTLITLPLIRSAIAVSMTNATIYAFNLFDEAWVLAGASLETRPVLVQIYLVTFQNLQLLLRHGHVAGDHARVAARVARLRPPRLPQYPLRLI